jgi:DNA polymerase I-like protein with 3'-5' exonuclease and polymerase domains/uracil-DNA glycosylase
MNLSEKYVPAQGSIGAKILLLKESPSIKDAQSGQLYSDDYDLDRLLKETKIYKSNCWLSAVSKFHIPESPKGKKIPFSQRATIAGVDLPEQIAKLQEEINAIKPNVIIPLGSGPLWTVYGKPHIENYRGSIVLGMGRKCIPTYNPRGLSGYSGAEFKGYWNRQIIAFDLKRAKLQSEFPDINRPSRILRVCRNSAELSEFIQRKKDKTRLGIDIEALRCIPTCLGLAFDRFEGMSVPLWNCNGISKIPDSDLAQIWLILAELLKNPKFKKVGQNFKYDEDKITRLGLSIDRLSSDTMLKAFAINPELPKSLAFSTSIFTEEPYYKDEGSDFDPSKQSIDDLFIYNARDACVTVEIDEEMDRDLDDLGMRDYYENFIMHLHPLYLHIESNGFRVDESKRLELLKKYVEWNEQLKFDLFNLVGDHVNANSPKQVSILLYEVLKLPFRAGTGEEELTELLKSSRVTEDHAKIIDNILLQRRIRKTIGSYITALPDFDGRMRTTYFLCTDTGRTSTGQQDPPIRPSIEYRDENNKLKHKSLGAAFQTLTKHGDVGADVRSAYIVDDGEVFLQADSSQAEARAVFLFADDEQALLDIDTHDYHALTASWFFGGTEDDYSKKKLGFESPIRFAGKTLRHAGHLGAGKARAATEINTQARKYKIDYRITESEAGRALEIFHRKQPKIRSNFHQGVVKALEKSRVLTAPKPYGVRSDVGGKRIFFDRWGDELFRMAFSYMAQRTITDSTKAAAIRIRRRLPKIKIIVEAHDALLCSVPEDKAELWGAIIKDEMERPIDFSKCSIPRRHLIVPCELEIGKNYQSLSKFKSPLFEPVSIPEIVSTRSADGWIML